MELYEVAGLHNDLTLTGLHFRITGVYLLCVMFTIVYMEHVMPINQALALLISFLQGAGKGISLRISSSCLIKAACYI